jgi:pyruvate/2-oxoglutarate dehydrogenase complex dihydrolipoamide acyltransferase (E2) component
MRVEMVMPQMGESITEGTVIRWTKKVGDLVARDENVLEISTDKVDSEIPSPAAGRVVELRAKEGETIPVGQVIAILETEVGAPVAEAAAPIPRAAAPTATPPAAPSGPVPSVTAPTAASPRRPAPLSLPVAAPSPAAPRSRQTGDRFYSPLVRAIAREEGVSAEELASLPGSGRDGRLTRDDLLSYLKTRGSSAPSDARTSAAAVAGVAAGGAMTAGGPAAEIVLARSGQDFEPYPKYTVSEVRKTPEGLIEVVQMDVMRQKIAEHMVRSKATSPHVASVTEVDMTQIVRYRERHRDDFESRQGFKLTYTPFIVAAAVRALIDYPMVNSSLDGTRILIKRFVNIGVAVALESGLIVPVVKNAEEMSFLGMARIIQDLAARARVKKLMPDEVQGGTFAVTNMGGFGNLFGIPIINQPNAGILGAGAIVKRPIVLHDAIAIRDIMYLSLSYDHRVIDGALGGRFIQRVRYYLEQTDLVGGA